MTQSQAWLVQIKSDAVAAERVHRPTEPATYCQAIAKCQQVAEKGIKAMVAAVNELGVEFQNISTDHWPAKELDALLNLNRAIDRDSVDYIKRTFTERNRKTIRELCELAPNYPKDGLTFLRNSEYPYHAPDGSWTAPAAIDSFTNNDVKRYKSLARVLVKRITRFIQAVHLRPGYRG